MKNILLIGAGLNIFGGFGIIASIFKEFPFSFPSVPRDSELNPPDYMLSRLFTAGTAFCFGSMYIFLYFNTAYAVPFLYFGMALKYWAFFAGLAASIWYRLPKVILVNFGFSNLLVAILFTIYLLNQ
jgi:hypothetical protein